MQQEKKFSDAIFVVTEERACPFYNVGEELKVEQHSLVVPEAKPACMVLVEKLIGITTKKQTFERFSQLGVQKSNFDCGGCQGMIRFEYKKEKGFATLQMKLLSETEARRRRQHLDKFFGRLRSFHLFESLDDDALGDLTALLELKKYPASKVVLKKGEPGTHLFILLSGQVGVIADDGHRLAEMSEGEIFGEMSLLSGEPVSCSIHSLKETEVAILSVKNFKHVLKKYPVLQLFLLKMLVDRAQAMTLRSGNITSGMSGELDEINMVELLQLINSSQKTGTIELILNDAKAVVLFNEGELIQVRYRNLVGKDALFALLAQKSGHFTYTKGIPPQMSNQPPLGGFMSLIMEGVQWIDEQEEQEWQEK
ncbi:MAG: cyclic nucleotide-binding domain-containing protein [Proteobacteria bacterium]|nr:cyclic nucleotide-binding domain-containing protein [Pseudomonadota bacterium]